MYGVASTTEQITEHDEWTPFFEEKLDACCLMLHGGGTTEDIVEYLHDGGLSAVESVTVISRLPEMSPTDAKRLVLTHPVWTEVAEASGPVWEDVQLILEREGQLIKLDDGTFVYQERLIPVATEPGIASDSFASANSI